MSNSTSGARKRKDGSLSEEYASEHKKHRGDDPPYDSDDEPPPSSDKLDWRLDPKESHSDWTIKIVRTKPSFRDGGNKTDTYHVHKTVLAFGDRKSEYFRRLFQCPRFNECETNTSKIELEYAAAEAFPALLDYLYDHDSDLELSTENAAALHYLGQYFQMPRLRWEAKQFWKKDLSVETCATYYDQAHLFDDEKIMKEVVKLCCTHLLDIVSSSRLVEVAGPELWMKISDGNSPVAPNDSKHLSTLVAKFCSLNDLTSEMLLQLTDKNRLPMIHRDAAKAFIEIEKSIRDREMTLGGEVMDGETTELSSLQIRCIEALAQDYESLDLSEDKFKTFLLKQSPAFLTKIMDKAMSNFKRDHNDLVSNLALSKSSEREQKKAALAQVTLKDSELAAARHELARARARFSKLEEDVKRFKPLPRGSKSRRNCPTSIPPWDSEKYEKPEGKKYATHYDGEHVCAVYYYQVRDTDESDSNESESDESGSDESDSSEFESDELP